MNSAQSTKRYEHHERTKQVQVQAVERNLVCSCYCSQVASQIAWPNLTKFGPVSSGSTGGSGNFRKRGSEPAAIRERDGEGGMVSELQNIQFFPLLFY